jgi:hypothetical protein
MTLVRHLRLHLVFAVRGRLTTSDGLLPALQEAVMAVEEEVVSRPIVSVIMEGRHPAATIAIGTNGTGGEQTHAAEAGVPGTLEMVGSLLLLSSTSKFTIV